LSAIRNGAMDVVHEGFVPAWTSVEVQIRTNNNRERSTRMSFMYSTYQRGESARENAGDKPNRRIFTRKLEYIFALFVIACTLQRSTQKWGCSCAVVVSPPIGSNPQKMRFCPDRRQSDLKQRLVSQRFLDSSSGFAVARNFLLISKRRRAIIPVGKLKVDLP
jgi:hypothetical protein